MILSTGIDIVEVSRIRETIARTPRFTERVYTPGERQYCDGKGIASAQSYATRFAAKEAFLKALKTGWRGRITWHDIEIEIDEAGAPSVKTTGEALEILTSLGVDTVHVSLAHTAQYAVAQVILESRR